MALSFTSRLRHILNHFDGRVFGGILCGVIFIALGIDFMYLSHAATSAVSAEAEQGTVNAPAKVSSDPTASRGSSITFGSSVPGPASTFTHPGIQYTKTQLDAVKAKLTSGAQPWSAAEKIALSSKYASTSWAPHPVSSVQCGNGLSPLNIGCDAQRDDSMAAYTQALLWYFTGNKAYADRAIGILNAWSGTLTAMPWDGTATYGNNKLQAGWSASNFIRAAEILRYSNAGWSQADITRFQNMLKNVYQPLVISGWSGGAFNWVTLLADTTMDIGVFNDDKATFNSGVAAWSAQVPAHIYASSDGQQPRMPSAPVKISSVPSYWRASTFVNGQTQETCRDLGHAAMGLASTVYAAETARIQGVDLYGQQGARIKAALELQATAVGYLRNGAAVPSNLCGGALNMGGGAAFQTGEVGYNEFANRLGQSMPASLQFLNWYRPIPTSVGNLHMSWESLTTVP